jgi:hypothetical protein
MSHGDFTEDLLNIKYLAASRAKRGWLSQLLATPCRLGKSAKLIRDIANSDASKNAGVRSWKGSLSARCVPVVE